MTVKCSAFIATSLDGFIARKDGGIDWLTKVSDANPEEDYGFKAFFDSVEMMVMGRNTFELVQTFKEWPYPGKKVIVLSSGSPRIQQNFTEQVEVMNGSPAEVVRRLSKRGIKHVYVDGGKTIQGFLKAGLLNEMTITLIPILIGTGIPLFGELSADIHLEHLETKAFDNGLVQNKYRVAYK